MNIGESAKASGVSFEFGFPALGLWRGVHVCERVHCHQQCATDAAGWKENVVAWPFNCKNAPN